MHLPISRSLHRSRIFLLLLFLAFTAFTADILDLRDEILIPASAADSLDNNIATGLQGSSSFKVAEISVFGYLPQQSMVAVYDRHPLAFDLRAPPFHS